MSEFTFFDTNGDGVTDTGFADTNGDGVTDTAALDTNFDGVMESVATDTNGDGVFDTVGVDTNLDGILDVTGVDLDGDLVIDSSTGVAPVAAPAPASPWDGMEMSVGPATNPNPLNGFSGPAFDTIRENEARIIDNSIHMGEVDNDWND